MILPQSRRLRRLGPLSLVGLLSGSGLLFLVGANCLAGKPSTVHNTRQFRLGSSLSIQFWLAVVGVGLGLFWYGLQEAWTHFYNYHCTSQAFSPQGLDYGRYLNSLPRAPTVYGWRGFKWMLTWRYCLLGLAICSTVGYKFSVVQVPISVVQAISSKDLILSIPSSDGMGKINGSTSPFFSDRPGGTNGAFFHIGIESPLDGPSQIVMVGEANCAGLFDSADTGYVVTREIVMVADRIQDPTDTVLHSDHTGWMRQRTSSWDWFPDSGDPAIVDYRIREPGIVEMRWARIFSSWDNCPGFSDTSKCDKTSYPAERNPTYSVSFARAEVIRPVKSGSCSSFPDDQNGLRMLGALDQEIVYEFSDASVPLYRNWVDTIIYKLDSTPLEGVSVSVRAVLCLWALYNQNVTTDLELGHDPNERRYPFFTGVRSNSKTGAYTAAAAAFLALAVAGLVVLLWRVISGPPQLTSWIGQHIILGRGAAFIDGFNPKVGSGYRTVDIDTYFVRLDPEQLSTNGYAPSFSLRGSTPAHTSTYTFSPNPTMSEPPLTQFDPYNYPQPNKLGYPVSQVHVPYNGPPGWQH